MQKPSATTAQLALLGLFTVRVFAAGLAMSLPVCFMVFLLLQQSAAQGALNIWRSGGPNTTNAWISTLAVDPFDSNIIFAAGPDGLFRSVDNGASWREDLNFPWPGAYDFTFDPNNPNTVFAASDGVYKSTDGGWNWTPSLIAGGAHRVEASPSDPNFIVAASFNDFRVFVSRNGGASWETHPSPPGFKYGDALEIDPQDPNNIYAAYVDGDFIHLRRSNNAGAAWTQFDWCPSDPCQPGDLFSSYTALFEIDPRDSNIVYASAFTGTFVSTAYSLFKSTDGGANWTRGGNMPRPRAMAVTPQGAKAIYVAAASGGVFRSFDEGHSWHSFSDGLGETPVYDLAFDRSASYLHAATAAGVYTVRLRPTYALSGRVLTPAGHPLRNVTVSITDTNGVKRSATTGSFGLYSFTDIREDSTYTVTVASRRYRFASQTVTVNTDLTNFDLIGQE